MTDQLGTMLTRCRTYTNLDDLEARDTLFATGERYDALVRLLRFGVDQLQEVLAVGRYEYVAEHVVGKKVVDCASGAGYGASILAQRGAESVLGIDLDPATVGYAQKHYGRSGTLRFVQGDALALGSLLVEPPDCVVSFETLEHLPEAGSFLDGVREVLMPRRGTLFLSCPIASAMDGDNPYHLHDFTPEAFASLVHERFAEVTLITQFYGLRPGLRKVGRLSRVLRNAWMGPHAGMFPADEVAWARRTLCHPFIQIAIARNP
ncbi:MAG: class I SAM-dependent methyltransferase [Armatimonadia bacterium]